MCRLFGISGGPHRVRATFWLLEAPDSLSKQSRRNPDGTGLGYYEEDRRPRVDRQPIAAYEDQRFASEARQVSSRTFVAHVRYASGTPVTLESTHPFLMDDRLFAHNGVLMGLPELEAELGDATAMVHGQTDSERYFALRCVSRTRTSCTCSNARPAAAGCTTRAPATGSESTATTCPTSGRW